MKIKHIAFTSLALAVATLMTACNDGHYQVKKPTELVKPTAPITPSNPTNPSNPTPQPTWDNTVSYGSLKAGAEADAVAYVRSELDVTPTNMSYSLTIDGKPQTSDINLSQYGKGHSTHKITETVTGTVAGERGSITRNSKAYIFQQDYSLVAGIHNVDMVANGQREEIDEVHFAIKGDPTKNLPTTGTFNYAGTGMVATSAGMSQGKFSYDVDFVEKTGSGSISGLSNSSDIILERGKIKPMTHKNEVDSSRISGYGIAGSASNGTYGGNYELGFFGSNAEEVAGALELGNGDAYGIFGGTKKAK